MTFQRGMPQGGAIMRVDLKRYENNNTDAVITIACDCGVTNMLDEAGEFQSAEIYVYRYGKPVKDLRCYPSEAQTMKRRAEGKPLCRERYRILVHSDGNGPPFFQVQHLTPRPVEEVLETETIQFPPKRQTPAEPFYPPEPMPYMIEPYG